MAQDIEYSIYVPDGARETAEKLPDSIDMNHYYSLLEISVLPKPVDSWEVFYRNMDTLEYPPRS